MAIGRQVDSIDSSPVGTYAALVLPALLGSKGEEVGKGEEGRQGKVVGWEVHGQRVSNYLKTIGRIVNDAREGLQGVCDRSVSS